MSIKKLDPQKKHQAYHKFATKSSFYYIKKINFFLKIIYTNQQSKAKL